MNDEPRSAYLHVPFCTHRCGYCNFTLIAGRPDLVESYLQAIERELAQLKHPREVDTLFLGGGTPTFLNPDQLARLLKLADRWFPVAVGGERSVEANPADITPEKVDVLHAAGVNRVSLGVQSFQANKLQLLERDHRRAEIEAAVGHILPRIPNLGVDLIFAAPGESLEAWRDDLQNAVRLGAPHISTYGLTFEKGTSFWNRLQHAELAEADEELQRAMYLTTVDDLSAAGLNHYEISNFARPGHESRHNLQYWLGRRYYAAGPGASRHIGMIRETNHRSTTTYLKRIFSGQSPVAEREELTPEMKARELLVFGLRMRAGVDVAAFTAESGMSPWQLAGTKIDQFVNLHLLEAISGRLRLTREGLLVSDAICIDLL